MSSDTKYEEIQEIFDDLYDLYDSHLVTVKVLQRFESGTYDSFDNYVDVTTSATDHCLWQQLEPGQRVIPTKGGQVIKNDVIAWFKGTSVISGEWQIARNGDLTDIYEITGVVKVPSMDSTSFTKVFLKRAGVQD